MPLEALEEVVAEPLPDDYAAYEARMDADGWAPGAQNQTPAVSDPTPPSEPAESEDEAGQTAETPEVSEDPQQEPEEEEGQPENNKRLARRMRTLTGKIAALESQLAGFTTEPEIADETTAEAASAPEPVTAAPPAAAVATQKPTRPMLRDFEDSDDKLAFDLWQEAMQQYDADLEAYHDGKLTAALDAHKADLANEKARGEAQAAKAAADATWNQAASRWPDYNAVVARDEVQISGAMEAVMRKDPNVGTALAYYLGQHPEESLEIAKATLAPTPEHWANALAEAGMRLGEIKAKLAAPPKAGTKTLTPAATPARKAPAAAPAAPPTTKKVSSASKPPTQIRSSGVPPKFDTANEDEAGDYGKWEAARERELTLRRGAGKR